MRPRPASGAARAWRRGLLAWIGWTLAAWLAIVWAGLLLYVTALLDGYGERLRCAGRRAGLLLYVTALLALRVDHYSAQDRR